MILRDLITPRKKYGIVLNYCPLVEPFPNLSGKNDSLKLASILRFASSNCKNENSVLRKNRRLLELGV